MAANTDLDTLEALHAGATAGKWSAEAEVDPDTGEAVNWLVVHDDGSSNIYTAWEPDSRAIVALHNAFPNLARELREARATIARLRSIVDALRPIVQEWWRADHENLNRRAEAAAWRLAIEAHTLIPTAGDVAPGEPDDRAAIARLTQERDAALRECDRWRHGQPVEGDYVCPNEAESVNARGEIARLAQCHAEVLEEYRLAEADVARLTAERDEARADYACALANGDAALDQRDQARAALKSLCFVDLGDDVAAYVDHIAQHIADLALNVATVTGERDQARAEGERMASAAVAIAAAEAAEHDIAREQLRFVGADAHTTELEEYAAKTARAIERRLRTLTPKETTR